MAKLIYRVISPCCILGYGFPRESFEKALDGRVDAIVCDAGSVDAGPFFLGAGASYFTPRQMRADLERIIAAAHRIGCAVIIGSAGMGGGDRNVAAVARIFADVFTHLGVDDATVATISSELPAARVIAEFNRGTLWPLGRGVALNEDALRQSTIVGQMGVHPIVTALEGGAQYVIAGRACDASIFAADMIRCGINPGLAYHVGHVLECGAIACEPASPADCLVAEIYDDGSAFFVAPNAERRCTVRSIAAHSLYEESHPQLQIYPEGVLTTEATEFRARDARVAGIRGSRLIRGSTRWSIKLEGARRVGHAYEWSVVHVLQNERIIREDLFPVTFHEVRGPIWIERGVRRPVYTEIAEADSFCSVDPLTLSVIDDVDPRGLTLGNQRLADMAVLIRWKNAAIGCVTFDVFFSSGDNYEAALLSNAFCRANIAKTLRIDPERIVGTYFADACNAIKITIDRPVAAASCGERDLYGEQQQAVLEELSVPIYSRALGTSSLF